VPRALRRTAFLFASLALALPTWGGEWKDDRDTSVSVIARPTRIVALSPHLAEIVHAAGAGDRLVAVVRHSDYPKSVRHLPTIGDAARFDMERLLALAPDLVLGWASGNPVHELRRVERLHLPLFVTEARRLGDVPRLLRSVGAIVDSAEAAEKAAGSFERGVAMLRSRYRTLQSIRVFYQIWDRPLLTVNGRHLISDVIELCGGRNVFADAPVLTPSVSLEAVLAARPDVILGGGSAAGADHLAKQWRAAPVALLRELPARYVPADLIQRQTPRILEGARIVCEHLDEVRRAGRVRE
jgi:iron complex transport system substrate-binding protein